MNHRVSIGRLAVGMSALVILVSAVPGPGAGPVHAQDPARERAFPSNLEASCEQAGADPAETPASAPEEARAEADRLAAEASRAAILGDREEARRLLEQAADLNPASKEVTYRLGRLLEGTGDSQRALVQFCRYLALHPDASEAEEVRQRALQLAALEVEGDLSPAPGGFRPATALFTGLVFPGSGHMYSDRPGRGALILLAAGASAVGGVLYTRTEVECLEDPGSDECPPDLILSQEQSRPYQRHGLLVAGAITVFTAVHAAVTVRRANRSGGAPLATALPVPGPGWDGNRPVMTIDPVLVAGSGPGLRASVRIPVP